MTMLLRSTIIALALIGASPALASDDNARVDYRQGLMSVIGGGMGTFGCFMKGNCETPGKLLASIAKGMKFATLQAETAYKTPTPNATVKTTASDKIWSDWEKFAGGLQKMDDLAGELLNVAVSGDKSQIGPVLGQLGKTCKGCHDNFREK